MVLEFHIVGTAVTLRWYWTGTQIGSFSIFIEVHCRVSHHLFEHQFYHFLLLGRKQDDAMPTHLSEESYIICIVPLKAFLKYKNGTL